MRNLFFAFIFYFFKISLLNAQVTINPAVFNVDDQITITVSLAPQTCNGIAANPAKVYMHAGIGNDNNAFAFNVIGNWGQDDNVGVMTNNGNNTWSITITPSVYFNLNAIQQANATKLGMVFRNPNGQQELKQPQTPSGCGDFIFNVGTFQLNLTAPANNSSTIINSGGSIAVAANNTGGNASYNLFANGVSINSNPSTASYSFTHTNITSNQNYELVVTQGTSTITRRFSVLVNPGTIAQAIPANMEDGINYFPGDPTKALLKLNAPGKDFVYVAGSFNNWEPNTNFAMRRDPVSNIFWLELTGLTPGQIYTYQYWVVKQNPVANSPVLVKTADMYSTLVLSNFDDPWIPASSYPNLPPYPQGQNREVTVLQTGQTPYQWSDATLNFQKPNPDDLVFYEVLIRDFDAGRNYQALIDRMDYFKNLNINALKIMPVMEFEGNESWGYNTSFHMANDKFYGTADKLKELIDVCHQNGIAVIFDLVLNHAFGRNPGVRMWMNDPDGDGWGPPASDNPYFNTQAMHSYNVGEDFNHQSELTRYYTRRVIKHWIEEYKIDGFRWDLTKGFTQNCPPNVAGGQESCTNGYHQDRVDVLRQYADYSWSLDPNHYVIFEHLGSDNEEQQWANYRLGEGKGIMLWGKMSDEYNELSMGFQASINRAGHVSRGFQGKRLIAYAESHDEERNMYRNLQFGNNFQPTHNVRNLEVALSRMSAIGAVLFTIPGPKMIWHFGALGMEQSIFTCSNGTVNLPNDPIPGDCKLDTKPQPQWANNWLSQPNRVKIYNDWAKLISLKINEPVFRGNYSISPDINNLRQRIYVWDDALPTSSLKNVVVIANFSVGSQNINPSFPYTGTWYDLMDNSSFQVSNTTATITVPPGQFRIFGNQSGLLSVDTMDLTEDIVLAPNPAHDYFTVNANLSKVEIYSITGQMVKSFNNEFTQDTSFDISDLSRGVYIVKVINAYHQEKTMKLMKQ
jgi:1,4-alpha-glucan branching enzyme